MAKTMAQIENGVVVNMLWCSDREVQTDTLIAVADRPVGIGDTYDGSNFYRDGEKVLTPLEDAQKLLAALREENKALVADMAKMVDEVYQSDIEILGI